MYILFYFIFQVDVNDPLPKTVCRKCIQKLELQHKIILQFKKAHQRFSTAAVRVN